MQHTETLFIQIVKCQVGLWWRGGPGGGDDGGCQKIDVSAGNETAIICETVVSLNSKVCHML